VAQLRPGTNELLADSSMFSGSLPPADEQLLAARPYSTPGEATFWPEGPSWFLLPASPSRSSLILRHAAADLNAATTELSPRQILRRRNILPCSFAYMFTQVRSQPESSTRILPIFHDSIALISSVNVGSQICVRQLHLRIWEHRLPQRTHAASPAPLRT
jgi:hypothetical protein